MRRKLGDFLPHRSKRPFHLIQVEPSSDCNLACVTCPWQELRATQGLMAWDTFARLAPVLRQTQSLDLSGAGEPLLNPELPGMLLVAKELGCEVGFRSNGTLLTAEMAHELVGVGVDWVSFAIDGTSASTYDVVRRHGDFEQVSRNIAGLRDARTARRSATPRIELSFTLMPGNHGELSALLGLAQTWGASHVVVRNLCATAEDGRARPRGADARGRSRSEPAGRLSSAERAIATAQRRATRLGVEFSLHGLQPAELAVCEADPMHRFFVDWAGNVSPCINLAHGGDGLIAGPQQGGLCVRFGNITHEPFEAIWEKQAFRHFRASWETRLRWEQETVASAMAGNEGPELADIPPAPAGCSVCSSLYGV